MKQSIQQKHLFIFALFLILALIFSGIFMVFRVFGQYEQIIIENEDRQLFGLVRSVDRSISSYLEQFSQELSHTVEHDGFTDAEAEYRRSGNIQIFSQYMEKNLLSQNWLTYDMLCIDNDKLLYSKRGKTDYIFPSGARREAEIEIKPCWDTSGTIYLSFLKTGEQNLQYAALIKLTDFYQAVAGNLIAGTQDRILLMDAGGRTILYQTPTGVAINFIDSDNPGAVNTDERNTLLESQNSKKNISLFYEIQSDEDQKPYTARMAAIPATGNNGVFAVCASLNYASIKRPIHMTAIRLTAYSSMIIIGILLLTALILFVGRHNERTERELALLREENLALEEITKKTQALAHHQRLETIGTLTSSIAHEFNNLLTPIMGYSILILEKLPSDEDEMYDNVLEIYEASRKAKTIISRLSDLSRKNTALTFQYIDPNELVRRVLDVAAPIKPSKVSVTTQLQCKHIWIHGNEIQLSQMLLNLILNAYQAMENTGGTVIITTKSEQDSICFSISDTGPGISPDILDSIFEPFFTTKERGKGTGLGLAIVQQVVKEHRGTINIDTELGKGTTMTVQLPTTPREDSTLEIE